MNRKRTAALTSAKLVFFYCPQNFFTIFIGYALTKDPPAKNESTGYRFNIYLFITYLFVIGPLRFFRPFRKKAN